MKVVLACVTVLLAATACSGDPSPIEDPPDADPGEPADSRAPAISFIAPAADDQDVAPQAAVIVVFDEAIDAETIDFGTLVLDGAGPSLVSATITVATTAIVLTPDAFLAPGDYEARLAAGVADLVGNATTDELVWQFSVTDLADLDPPSIVLIEPADNATDVALGSRVRIFFDEAIAPTSATGAVMLTDATGTSVAATTSVLGSVVQVTPNQALRPTTTYDVEVAATIADLSGNPSGSARSWSFETIVVSDGWSTPVPLHAGAGDSGLPVVVSNTVGGIDVLWISLVSDAYDIRHAHFSPATGWDDDLLVETTGPGTCLQPDVGAAESGVLAATWTYRDDQASLTQARTSRYQPGAGWSSEEVLSSAVQLGFGLPRIGVARNGLAAAVWQPNAFQDGLRVRRYDPMDGWSAEDIVLPASPTADSSEEPTIRVTESGDMVLIWLEHEQASLHLASATYVSGAGWSASQRMGIGTLSERYPTLAMDRFGSAMVVWLGHGSGWNIWARPWDPGVGWGTTEIIDQTTDDTDSPRVSIGIEGAIAVWTEWPAGGRRVVARRWTGVSGWSAPVVLDTDVLGIPYPSVDVGDDRAVVAWPRTVGSDTTIWAATFENDDGWQPRLPVATGIAQLPTLLAAVDGSGVPMLVWSATIGGSALSVFAARADP